VVVVVPPRVTAFGYTVAGCIVIVDDGSTIGFGYAFYFAIYRPGNFANAVRGGQV